ARAVRSWAERGPGQQRSSASPRRPPPRSMPSARPSRVTPHDAACAGRSTNSVPSGPERVAPPSVCHSSRFRPYRSLTPEKKRARSSRSRSISSNRTVMPRNSVRRSSGFGGMKRKSIRRPRPSPAGPVVEPAPPLLGQKRVGERPEAALEHLLLVREDEVDAVVGDAVLRVVVRADLLGPLAGAELRAAGGRDIGLLLGPRPLVQARAQDPHGPLAVLELALLVLHGDDEPR